MTGIWQLAWRYVRFNKTKTLILIACIFLTAILPIAIRILLTRFEQSILQRADSTPAVIGRRGSQLDLVLHSLYFDRELDERLTFAEVASVRKTNLGTPVPVYSAFRASSFPIVGTTLEYFAQRQLIVRDGSMLSRLGDCVIGAEVARRLNVRQGDDLLSDRQNALDLAGKYPLKMKVVGVLANAHSPDDRAVFVDLKTAWVIDGFGHGHQNLNGETDPEKVIKRDDDRLIASAAVLPFTQITDENIDSFHFHGSLDDFPISAILAFTNNAKDDTLLQGIYETEHPTLQLARPTPIVRQLMQLVFQVQQFFNANAALIALATLLLLGLVVLLSARLRQQEMETMFKLGCTRGTIALLQLAELTIVFLAAATLVALASWVVWHYADDLLINWIRN